MLIIDARAGAAGGEERNRSRRSEKEVPLLFELMLLCFIFMKRWVFAIILVAMFWLVAKAVVPYAKYTYLIAPIKYHRIRNQELDPKPLKGETLNNWLARKYGVIKWQMDKKDELVEISALIETDDGAAVIKWTRTYGSLPILRVANKGAVEITPEIYDPALQGQLPD